ncbi:hypothetical protein NRB_26470 [Novosphingobium sp. 11B]
MFDTPLPAISLAVVGIEFDNRDGSNRRFAMAMCEPGDPVELRLEPDNPADENAVAVYNADGMQMGYISSQRAVRISALLRAGREMRAVLQRKAKFGGWVRLAFDGEDPKLTPAMIATGPDEADGSTAEPDSQVPASDPDFYPDETWPDDY